MKNGRLVHVDGPTEGTIMGAQVRGEVKLEGGIRN